MGLPSLVSDSACPMLRVSIMLTNLHLLSASTAPMPFTALTQLADVLPSGDTYPDTMVAPSDEHAFAGTKVLFAMSHGVEDHEVYYQHQYFIQRGASVVFGCPASAVPGAARCILSDFYKPTYSVAFEDLAAVNLASFDAVFVPGGLPSSSDLRRDAGFPRKLYDFWRTPASRGKLVAIICSGNEVLIESGMLADAQLDGPITGSPASNLSLTAGLAAVGKDATLYKGLDPDHAYDAIAYAGNDNRSALVLGRNPAASPRFVAAIGQSWRSLDERWDGPQVAVTRDTSGRYSHPQFRPLDDGTNVSQLARPPPIHAPPLPGRLFGAANALLNYSVALAISSGQADAARQALAYLGQVTQVVTQVGPR